MLIFTLMDKFVMPKAGFINDLLSPSAALVVSTYASAAVGRVCSSLLNFTINKNLVFKKNGGTLGSMAKYITLVVCIYLVSSTAVSLLRGVLPFDVTLIKICIDMLLMLVSYTMQQKWVFAKKDGKDGEEK